MQTFINHFNRHISTEEDSGDQPTLAENSPEKLLEKYAAEHKSIACKVVREGNYNNIVKKLESKKDSENFNFLTEQINRVQREYEQILNTDTTNFLFQEDENSLGVWQALTILELYDKNTFEHSLQTFLIAKSKIDSPIYVGERIIDLKKIIKDENLVNLDQFYRACLLHDIGKIEIPHFLIASSIKNSEWSELLLDFDEKNYVANPQKETPHKLLNQILTDNSIDLPAEIKAYPEATKTQKEEKKSMLIKFLTENYLRCAPYVPISEAINNPILENRAFSLKNIAELKRRHFSLESSLLQIVQSHEISSKIILESLNLQNEAILVGSHHDYNGTYSMKYEKYPLTISQFNLSERMSEFLRIADMHEAIHNKRRPHADGRSQIDCLIILAKSINKKRIHPWIAYAWLVDELQKVKETKIHDSKKVAILEGYVSALKDEL